MMTNTNENRASQFMGTAQLARIDPSRLKRVIDELVDIAVGAATADGRVVFDAHLTIRLEYDASPAPTAPA